MEAQPSSDLDDSWNLFTIHHLIDRVATRSKKFGELVGSQKKREVLEGRHGASPSSR
jgi:hypothetical protein